MSKLRDHWDHYKGNKAVWIIALALVLLCVEAVTGIFSKETEYLFGGDRTAVAVLKQVENDVRQKPGDEPKWYRGEPQADILRGDAVYTGTQSRAGITMLTGGQIDLGEETLVVFDDVDGVTIPDVARGSVRLQLSGDMRIAISGQMTEFNAQNSELAISVDESRRATVEVKKGQAKITSPGVAPRAINAGERFEVPVDRSPAVHAMRVKVPPKIDLSKLPSMPSIAKAKSRTRAKATVAATPAPAVVEAPAPTAAPVKIVEVEEPRVIEPVVAEAAPEPTPEPTPEPARKLELAPAELAQTHILKIQDVYARGRGRELVRKTENKILKSTVTLRWSNARPEDQVKVQVARDASFAKPWLEREASAGELPVREWRPGLSYWRVSRDGHEWSEVGKVFVNPKLAEGRDPKIEALKSRLVLSSNRSRPTEAKLKFADSGITKPRGWVLQGSKDADFAYGKTKTVWIAESRVDVPLTSAGEYHFRVRSVDASGAISTFSRAVTIEVAKPLPPPVPVRLARKEKPPENQPEPTPEPRKVASVEQEPVAKMETTAPVRERVRNYRPRPWTFILEGGETALLSSDQIEAGGNPALMHTLGLGVGYANEKHATRLHARTKVGGSNAEGESQSTSDLEVRYTRWWKSSWNPFTGGFKLGWVGAYEQHRNASSSVFTSSYETAKTGLGVDIGFAGRWKTGGDLLYGRWLDSNQVFQVNGFIAYDLKEELNFGVGYRLNLFDAGSSSASPSGYLPYREATGEAYSALSVSF